MEKKKLVPKRRFRGFIDTWSTKKISDIAEIFGGGTPSTSIQEYWNGDINWYSPTEIGQNTIVNESEKKITELGLQNSSARILPAHKTILFTSRAGIGDMAILADDAATNQGFQSLVLTKDNDVYFIYSMGFKIKKHALKNASGSTFLEISGKELEKTPINVPVLAEQQKIGEFFKVLDERIANQERKIAKVKSLKEAYLTEMFPQEGETVPKRRFEGFDGKWEKIKLSELTMYQNGIGHEKLVVYSGRYELINLNSISIHGGLKSSGKYVNESNHLLMSNDLVMILSDVGHGDLLGKVALIPESGRYALNQRVALLRPNKWVNPLYLLYFINREKSYFKNNGAGMSQLNISKQIVENYYVFLPNLEEQQKIGAFFKNLDDQIQAEELKLEKLKKMKEAYLEEMFV